MRAYDAKGLIRARRVTAVLARAGLGALGLTPVCALVAIWSPWHAQFVLTGAVSLVTGGWLCSVANSYEKELAKAVKAMPHD